MSDEKSSLGVYVIVQYFVYNGLNVALEKGKLKEIFGWFRRSSSACQPSWSFWGIITWDMATGTWRQRSQRCKRLPRSIRRRSPRRTATSWRCQPSRPQPARPPPSPPSPSHHNRPTTPSGQTSAVTSAARLSAGAERGVLTINNQAWRPTRTTRPTSCAPATLARTRSSST